MEAIFEPGCNQLVETGLTAGVVGKIRKLELDTWGAYWPSHERLCHGLCTHPKQHSDIHPVHLLWNRNYAYAATLAAAAAAMRAFEPYVQTPIYIIQQLCAHRSSSPLAAAASSQAAATATADQSLQAGPAAFQAAGVSAAVLPWLLLLSRLMLLRGKLLGHLLAHEADESRKAGATSALHTAYWHVKMAHESASTLAAQLKIWGSSSLSSSAAAEGQPPAADQAAVELHQQQQQQERAQVQLELQQQLLPALKQAVQVLRAAMKLSRHFHETGFASGFAAGFAAGYAAAVAAASGVKGSGPSAPVSFASPWGVLQQGCIRGLPRQLESVGAALAGLLRHVGCCNPLCVNLSTGSELWLVPGSAGGGASSSGPGVAEAGEGPNGAGTAGDVCDVQGMAGVQGRAHAALCCSCSNLKTAAAAAAT